MLLGGVVIVIGMMVDGVIVIVENVDWGFWESDLFVD